MISKARVSGRKQGGNYRASHILCNGVLQEGKLLLFAKEQASRYWASTSGATHDDESEFLLGFLESYQEKSRESQPKDTFDDGVRATYSDLSAHPQRWGKLTRFLGRTEEE